MEILIDAFSVLTGNYQYSGSMFPGVEEALIHLTLIKDESSTYVAAAPPEVYRLAVNEVISEGQGPYVIHHFAYAVDLLQVGRSTTSTRHRRQRHPGCSQDLTGFQYLVAVSGKLLI